MIETFANPALIPLAAGFTAVVATCWRFDRCLTKAFEARSDITSLLQVELRIDTTDARATIEAGGAPDWDAVSRRSDFRIAVLDDLGTVPLARHAWALFWGRNPRNLYTRRVLAYWPGGTTEPAEHI